MKPTREERIAAVEASLKHWEEDYPQGVVWGKHAGDWNPPADGDSCALCKLHHAVYRKYEHEKTCGECPLWDAPSCHPAYEAMSRAAFITDRAAWQEEHKRILNALEDALEKEKARKPERPTIRQIWSCRGTIGMRTTKGYKKFCLFQYNPNKYVLYSLPVKGPMDRWSDTTYASTDLAPESWTIEYPSD